LQRYCTKSQVPCEALTYIAKPGFAYEGTLEEAPLTLADVVEVLTLLEITQNKEAKTKKDVTKTNNNGAVNPLLSIDI